MKLSSYLQSAQKILVVYEFPQPFHLFLKTYFKTNKQFGSKDRKVVAALLFGYFRIGKQAQLSTENAMIAGLYICKNIDLALFEKLLPELAESYLSDYATKLENLKEQFQIEVISQNFSKLISDQIDESVFLASLLVNPKIFIRTRVETSVLEKKLQEKEIPYSVMDNYTICFADNLNLQEVLPENKLYVVQDLSSQQVCKQFAPAPNELWWDCCAASGGKSIALMDKQKDVQLTVSDIRENILQNLHIRFKQYNISKYISLVLNMCAPIMEVRSILFSKKFNKIICDVPCSGSGTWSRTPEQLYFFKEQSLEGLLPNGIVYYITCSTMHAENEDVINHVTSNNQNIKIIQQQYISNAAMGGDTMFIAQLSLA
jgi:16S rRNA (cytosine967-C5)-methyltransferase